MDRPVLWHNPRCSTSRAALALLRERGVEPELRLYLEKPPSEAELDALLTLIGGDPHDALRTKESEYADAGLSEASGRAAIVAAIATSPRLLQRPILVRGRRAVVGRPADRVLELL